MEKLKLSDLVRRSSKFDLSIEDENGKIKTLEIKLNRVTAADEDWIIETFGSGENLEKAFSGGKLHEICKLAYRLMDYESKTLFKKKIVKYIDDKGDEFEQEIGGVDLFYSMFSNYKDIENLFKSLIETIGLSRPVIEQIEKEEAKKKHPAMKKIGRK